MIKIRAFINGWNDRCQPFVWTKTADRSGNASVRLERRFRTSRTYLRQTYRPGMTARMTAIRKQLITVQVMATSRSPAVASKEGEQGEPEELAARREQQQSQRLDRVAQPTKARSDMPVRMQRHAPQGRGPPALDPPAAR